MIIDCRFDDLRMGCPPKSLVASVRSNVVAQASGEARVRGTPRGLRQRTLCYQLPKGDAPMVVDLTPGTCGPPNADPAVTPQPSKQLIHQPVELARRLIQVRQGIVLPQQGGGVEVGEVELPAERRKRARFLVGSARPKRPRSSMAAPWSGDQM